MEIGQWIDRFMHATAWEMTTPEAYGAFHLLFTGIGLALSVLAAYALRHASERTNRCVLLSAGLVLAVSEVYKQFFHYYYIHSDHSYAWWIFPFQLCSIPMYFCLIVPFLPEGKIKRGMYNFMFSFNLLGGFMAFIEPSGILHGYLTLTLHSCCWHMILVFVGLYLGFSRRAGREKKDFLAACGTFLGLCVVAFAINLIFWDAAGGDINMFFIGPRNSPLIVFSTIAEKLGWYVSTALYIPTVCLGAFVVFSAFRYLTRPKKETPHPTHETPLLLTK